MTVKIDNGHAAGYQNDRPVIVISHQLQVEHCHELLPLIIKTLGASQVRNELEKHVTSVERGQFMCYVPGGGVPTVTHEYRNLAEAEAVRLAGKTGLDLMVVRVVSTTKRKVVPVPEQYEVVVEPVK